MGSSLKSEDQIQFLRRLIPHLTGHRLVDLGDCDVVISIGKPERDVEDKPLLIKWDDTCDNFTEGDAFIVQHNDCVFDDRCVVINDGIDINNKISELPTGFQSIGRDYDVVFVVSSPRWSRSDHLDEVMFDYQSLKQRYAEAGQRTAIIFMGDGFPNEVKRGNDAYTVPWLEESERLQLYSSANWCFSYSDRTQLPVEVLESISQGTPVIHNNNPVISNLLGNLGFLVTELPTMPPKYPWDIARFDIHEVAKKYSDIIESLALKSICQ